jgi:hypothetical protein
MTISFDRSPEKILHCSMVILFNPKPVPKPLQCFDYCYMPAVALETVSFTYSIGNAPIARVTRESEASRFAFACVEDYW